jgi:hypothetical protein
MNTKIMNIGTHAYIVLGTGVLLILATTPFLSPMVQSQEEEDDSDEEDAGSGGEEAVSLPPPTATIVNSKYLTLSGITFNEADNQVTLSGNVSNISPDQPFTNIVVVGELYDEQNMLITAATGRTGLANLQPGQQSAFTLTTNIPSVDEVARYTILPGGSTG